MKSVESSISNVRMDHAAIGAHGYSQSLDLGGNTPVAPKLSTYFATVLQRYLTF